MIRSFAAIGVNLVAIVDYIVAWFLPEQVPIHRELDNTGLMAQLLAFAWVFTVIFTVRLAVMRGMSIRQAFNSVNTWAGLITSVTVLVITCFLLWLQATSPAELLGQRPLGWAMLVLLVYAWFCISHQMRKS